MVPRALDSQNSQWEGHTLGRVGVQLQEAQNMTLGARVSLTEAFRCNSSWNTRKSDLSGCTWVVAAPPPTTRLAKCVQE